MILELMEFTGKDWGEKFSGKPSELFIVKLFGLYQLKHVYYRGNQRNRSQKRALRHPLLFTTHCSSSSRSKRLDQSRETFSGTGSLIPGADRLILDVKTCETHG